MQKISVPTIFHILKYLHYHYIHVIIQSLLTAVRTCAIADQPSNTQNSESVGRLVSLKLT